MNFFAIFLSPLNLAGGLPFRLPLVALVSSSSSVGFCASAMFIWIGGAVNPGVKYCKVSSSSIGWFWTGIAAIPWVMASNSPEYRGGFLGFGGSLVFPTAFPLLTAVPGRSSKDRGWEFFPLFSSGHIFLRQFWILWSRRGFLLRSGVRTRRLLFRCIRYGR